MGADDGMGEFVVAPDAPAVAVPARARTVGVSPKLVVAVASAEASFLLGQEILALPVWAVLLLNVVMVGLGVWRAAPGETVPAGS